ncbi:branched-chain amino acid ABC transporter substrate-binding protein [Microaerobacter geothermalis]|uniref:branched-chain amino acid ABC transporter substrate-binding protein n=1 Tax=Microaerobacter geothermalis TaxID=674972 RepID=UPI001F1682FB|nr:branched-chain amino acid ABC transporter substrate-binding protein [Microaerobacter geothermalis]MCF6094480.1 branched-chain amino acid ABC transporter substrate-binding protein [Microaerobacter geothermalis]
MKNKKLFYVLLVVLAVGLILVGCGSSEKASTSSNSSSSTSSSSDSSSSSNSSSSETTVVKIATQSPLSGPYSAMGEAIKLGAEMALADNAEKFKALGVELQLFPQDDQGDPKIGVSNAEGIVSDKQVLALVGHLNSGVARAAGPKYEAAKLPVVSPANTAVDLTTYGWATFHRIVAKDDVQGPAGAKFAFEDLGAKSVYVVHDKTAYGQGLAEAFQEGAKALGMNVLGFEGQEATQTDFTALVNKIVAMKPDAIYFGGMYNQAGLLVKQANERGFQGYFLSGDGSDNAELIKIAGVDNVKKTYITSVAGDASRTEEGKAWTQRYKEKFGKDSSTFSVYGYDATLVVLNALEKAINENGGKVPTREELNKYVSATKDLKGVFTTTTFDEKGDNINAEVFIYSFEEGTYPAKFIKTVSVK